MTRGLSRLDGVDSSCATTGEIATPEGVTSPRWSTPVGSIVTVSDVVPPKRPDGHHGAGTYLGRAGQPSDSREQVRLPALRVTLACGDAPDEPVELDAQRLGAQVVR